ncbi:DUF1013 domain-containing protein [Candidatus Bealeia paramacronuclearis]|uniref:DUF1013 domain-containing protein n=2 Tax=Candidatus Bealeia paramacronuclearis TaxID=1921001 RepID=A0ABZ2C5S5_9PROT|nr:hypothetical protein [Candidatus Bealeia paramacronuclearis]
MSGPLMPKATAVWLIENTTLTFEQIGAFCGFHALEIQAIADGEIAIGIMGRDPITAGELTTAEIERCQKNPTAQLALRTDKWEKPKKRKGGKYTPVSIRQDKPDGIAWVLKHCPDFSDTDIIKLLGTTKATINSIRNKTHKNSTEMKPQNPVTLGLCSQAELDVLKAKYPKAVQED